MLGQPETPRDHSYELPKASRRGCNRFERVNRCRPTVTHPVEIPMPILKTSWYFLTHGCLERDHALAHLKAHPHDPLRVVVLVHRDAEEKPSSRRLRTCPACHHA